MSNKTIIEARHLGKVYDASGNPVRALEQISFSVAEGELVSIVGPSGCGKSTIMQIVGGLMPASSGEALIEGQPVTKPLPDKIAMVFQDALLLPWKTARDNVELPLALRGADKKDRQQRAVAMLELVGLADFMDRYPHELSGGMKQRVSIARGLAQAPRIILMDEPFGALDEQTRIRMGEELSRIRAATKQTVLFITHSLSEAIYLSNRVLVMAARPGRIIDEVHVGDSIVPPIEMMETDHFAKLRSHIWKLISPQVDIDEPPPL